MLTKTASKKFYSHTAVSAKAGGGAGAEAAAFLARTSGLDTTHTNAYTALINGLVADGIWSKFDALYVLATQNTTTALLSLVSATYNMTLNGSLTFTTDRGYTGAVNGSTSNYLKTNFTAATAPSPKYTQNSAHYSVWSVIDTGANSGSPIGFYQGGVMETQIYPKYTDNNAYLRVNSTAQIGAAVATSIGFFLGNRSNSTTMDFYRNGSSIATSSSASSTGLISQQFYVCAQNNNGIGAGGSTHQIAAASIGSSLNSTEAANFYNRLRTYMLAVGLTGIDPVVDFLARTSGLDTTHTNAYTDLINGLVTDGIWTKLDALYIFATQDSTTARLNLKSTSFTGTVSGTPVFVADRGYTGTEGTHNSDYINTNCDMNGALYVQNSAHLSAWVVTNGQSANGPAGWYYSTSTNGCLLQPRTTSDLAALNINNVAGTGPTIASTDSRGFWHVNRSASGAAQLYKNGASILTSTATTGSLNAIKIHANGWNDSNSFHNGYGQQVAAVSIGSSLSSTDATNFYNRLRTYMTAVGVP